MPIRPGQQGPAVGALQEQLNLYTPVTPKLVRDQRYGTQTERAVRQYQQAMGLPVTGVADDQTLLALGLDSYGGPGTPGRPTEMPFGTPPGGAPPGGDNTLLYLGAGALLLVLLLT